MLLPFAFARWNARAPAKKNSRFCGKYLGERASNARRQQQIKRLTELCCFDRNNISARYGTPAGAAAATERGNRRSREKAMKNMQIKWEEKEILKSNALGVECSSWF